MPLVDFRDDFGVRESIFERFLMILGCWRALGHPSGPHLASMTETNLKKAKKEPKMETFWGPLPSFWPLGGHLGANLEAQGGKKSVPEASEGDFADIVKTQFVIMFL